MDSRKLQTICEQLTKSLTPFRVEILEPTEKSFTLRVVSNHFQDMSVLARSNLLSALFENQAQDIVSHYLFDFEVWTEAEFASLPEDTEKENGKKSAHSQRIAARSPEL